MIRTVVVFLVLICAIGFGLQNHAETVTIHYLPGMATEGVAVYVLAMGSFAVGMAAAILIMLPTWMKDKLALRKHRKSLSRAEDLLSRMRSVGEKNTENVKPDE